MTLILLALVVGTIAGTWLEKDLLQGSAHEIRPEQPRLITGTLVYLSDREALIDTDIGRVALSIGTATRFTGALGSEPIEDIRKLNVTTSSDSFKTGDTVRVSINVGEHFNALGIAHMSQTPTP